MPGMKQRVKDSVSLFLLRRFPRLNTQQIIRIAFLFFRREIPVVINQFPQSFFGF